MRQFGRRELDATILAPDGTKGRVFAMDGIGANAEFLELLAAGQVVSMHTREASLDDVFIAATRAPGRLS